MFVYYYTTDELTLPLHYRHADHPETDMSTPHSLMKTTSKPQSLSAAPTNYSNVWCLVKGDSNRTKKLLFGISIQVADIAKSTSLIPTRVSKVRPVFSRCV